ncbi:MAG: 50S ribosomal protein L4 [Halobacteriales archaeon]|nr:50S ribosomal protein L4 [Halobacteriales archaeon]
MPQKLDVNVYGQDGNVKGQARLPEAFGEPLRPDLVRKAVNVLHANARQPYGSDPDAGKRAVVLATRPGQGMSRVTRGVGTGKAAFGPNNVGGRRAHPPLVEKDWSEKINKKERAKALRAALAATASAESVRQRGHKFKEGLTLPIVVEQRIEGVAKTSELLGILNKLGVAADVQRAGDGTHQRAGRGKLRGRRMRTPRSLLLVAPYGSPVHKAAQNLPGVDIASPEQINLDMVAPGGDTGRLLVITEGGLARLVEVLA